jgi:glutamate-1-semialdehyde aminotransferase
MTGTFSKHPRAWGFLDDVSVDRASGATLGLSDGRQYIDWVSGLGSNLLGYAHPWQIDHLVKELIKTGGSLSLTATLEHTVAEKLADLLGKHVPGWSPEFTGIRFAKSGSDVTGMAVRLAKAIMGRERIITFENHYHGWHDWTVSRTPPASGVGFWPSIKQARFNDIESVKAIIDDNAGSIAAIIFEHPLDEITPGFYTYLRHICDQHNILLIVDEVVTGLRYGLGGACELYDIQPDLICMGKALGNGLPISVLAGHKEYMDAFAKVNPPFCSSTFWGETVGLAAADWVLDNINDGIIKTIWETGVALKAGLRTIGWRVAGHPPRSLLVFDSPYEQAFFIQGMRKRGVLMNRPNFPTLAHTGAMVTYTLESAHAVRVEMDKLEAAQVEEQMKDYLPMVLFRGR